MAVLLGFDDWLVPVGSGQFYCKACDGPSSFVIVQHHPFLYLAYVPIIPVAESRRVVQCQGCKKEFGESVFDDGSPMIFLNSRLEKDGSIMFGVRSQEIELPASSEWALGCWFDGLWYPVALGRHDGNRRLALFGDRGCAWLEPEYVVPMDVRIGDTALIARYVEDDQIRYASARILTWEPDFRSNVVEFVTGMRDVVSRAAVCFKRPVRHRWKLGDRVLAYRSEGAYFPGIVRQVKPIVEIRFDDGEVADIHCRMVEPFAPPPNTHVFLRNHEGAKFTYGQVVSWADDSVSIRLQSGATTVVALDRVAVPVDAFMPSAEDIRTFYLSATADAAPDWQGNTNQLSQAIQAAGRHSIKWDDVDDQFAGGNPTR